MVGPCHLPTSPAFKPVLSPCLQRSGGSCPYSLAGQARSSRAASSSTRSGTAGTTQGDHGDSMSLFTACGPSSTRPTPMGACCTRCTGWATSSSSAPDTNGGATATTIRLSSIRNRWEQGPENCRDALVDLTAAVCSEAYTQFGLVRSATWTGFDVLFTSPAGAVRFSEAVARMLTSKGLTPAIAIATDRQADAEPHARELLTQVKHSGIVMSGRTWGPSVKSSGLIPSELIAIDGPFGKEVIARFDLDELPNTAAA